MTIDIIVCFCDKDYTLIDRFLSYIKRLTFDYQLTLIDNRVDKSIDLHEKLANYNYLIPEKDRGLFESRRYGFEHTNNEFIWFVDIDDEIFDFKLNIQPNDDIVLYNFKVHDLNKDIIGNNERCYTNRIYKIDPNNDSQIGYVNYYFMHDGIWNKIFNRKTLKKCYDSIPFLENFFIYEDLFLEKHFSYFASIFRTDTQYIYQWNMTTTYEIKDHMEDGEKFYSLIANPKLKKEYRKYLDLIYIQLDSEN